MSELNNQCQIIIWLLIIKDQKKHWKSKNENTAQLLYIYIKKKTSCKQK